MSDQVSRDIQERLDAMCVRAYAYPTSAESAADFGRTGKLRSQNLACGVLRIVRPDDPERKTFFVALVGRDADRAAKLLRLRGTPTELTEEEIATLKARRLTVELEHAVRGGGETVDSAHFGERGVDLFRDGRLSARGPYDG